MRQFAQEVFILISFELTFHGDHVVQDLDIKVFCFQSGDQGVYDESVIFVPDVYCKSEVMGWFFIIRVPANVLLISLH